MRIVDASSSSSSSSTMRNRRGPSMSRYNRSSLALSLSLLLLLETTTANNPFQSKFSRCWSSRPSSSVLKTAQSVTGGASQDPSRDNRTDVTAASSAEGGSPQENKPPVIVTMQQQQQGAQAVNVDTTNAETTSAPPVATTTPKTTSPKPPTTPALSSSSSSTPGTTFMNTPQTVNQRTSWKSLQGKVASLKAKTVQPFQSSWQTLQKSDKHASSIFSAIGPAILALLGTQQKGRLGLVSIYALALLGSSVGFYLFLYFISVGYAAGITLPLVAALFKYCRAIPSSQRSVAAILHTALVICWGVRSIVFYLYREHVNWPALHQKIVQVNTTKTPSTGIKVLCWLVYSALYVCMLSPCWFRLNAAAAAASAAGSTTVKLTAARWPLLLQVAGLLLETVADWQKSSFKLKRRYEWCNTGVWKYSTHPNYAGEWLFWLGTVAGGVPAIQQPLQAVMMLVGFGFISTVLRGAVVSLDQKHWEKYGSISEFAAFVQRYTVFGPKVWQKNDLLQSVDAQVSSATGDDQRVEGARPVGS